MGKARTNERLGVVRMKLWNAKVYVRVCVVRPKKSM